MRQINNGIKMGIPTRIGKTPSLLFLKCIVSESSSIVPATSPWLSADHILMASTAIFHSCLCRRSSFDKIALYSLSPLLCCSRINKKRLGSRLEMILGRQQSLYINAALALLCHFSSPAGAKGGFGTWLDERFYSSILCWPSFSIS